MASAVFDLTGRSYYVTGVSGSDPGENEIIDRLDMGSIVRIYGGHALGLQYIASLLDADYPDRPDGHQTVKTVSSFTLCQATPGSALSSGRS